MKSTILSTYKVSDISQVAINLQNDRHAQEVNWGEESNHEAPNTILHNQNKNLVLAHVVEEIGDEPHNTSFSS